MRVEHGAQDDLEVEIGSEAETERLGRAISTVLRPDAIVGLVGPLGAGKTRLVRAIAGALGVDPDLVTSPTYVLIHEYDGVLPVFHFDAYRLGGPEPFETLGVDDYWDAGGVCLVEWADLVGDRLPARRLWIVIEPTGLSTRNVRISGLDPSSVARLTHLLNEPI